MKRATRIALIAVLCWLGLAQAVIRWGPLCPVDADPYAQTGSNNTWAVTGCGGTIDVAYVKDGHVWFRQSLNYGVSWSDAKQLDYGYAASSSSPSLVKLDADAQFLIATFWTDEGHNTGVPEVYCLGSTDGGGWWGTPVKANGRDWNDDHENHRMFGFLPSAATMPREQPPYSDRNMDVVCRESRAGLPGLDSIGWNGMHFPTSSEDINGQYCIFHYASVDLANYFGAPSVWGMALVSDAFGGCAWQVPPHDILTNYKQGAPYSRDPIYVQDPGNRTFYNVGYPSIACADSIAYTSDRGPAHEGVAFEAKTSPSSNDTVIELAFRTWKFEDEDWIPLSSGWQPPCHWSPAWPNSGGFECHRPNICAQGVEGRGDTFVVAFTGYPVGGGGAGQPREIFYSRIWNTEQTSNPDDGWYAEQPRALSNWADSVNIYHVRGSRLRPV